MRRRPWKRICAERAIGAPGRMAWRKYRLAPREGLFKEDKDLAAAYRRLVRAGFRTGEIVRVLKRFAKNPELLDDFEPPAEDTEN